MKNKKARRIIDRLIASRVTDGNKDDYDYESAENELEALLQERERKAYKKGREGREDRETELTRSILLAGEPRNFIGMDTPDRKLSRKYTNLISTKEKEKHGN